MSADDVDDTGIGTHLVRSLPTRPLTAEEWDLVEDIDGLSNAAPVGFYVHNGTVTHFIIQFSGSSRVIGWNPLRNRWELIVLIDPRENDTGERTVKTISTETADGTPEIEFDLGEDFNDSVMDFIERYAEHTFQNQIEPTLPSELDAAVKRQELIDAAADE